MRDKQNTYIVAVDLNKKTNSVVTIDNCLAKL